MEIHDPCPGAWNYCGGQHEGLAVAVVESLGYVSGEFNVLTLVGAYRHIVGVIEQDIGRLQRRIGEQTSGDELLAVGFVLELRHSGEFPERRGAFEQPGAFGVFVQMALHEQGADIGVQPGGYQHLGEPQ